MTRKALLVGVVLGLAPTVSVVADEPPTSRPAEDHRRQENPDQPYLPVDRDEQARTPPARAARNGFVSVQVNVDANGNNIVGDAANEPSIAVDPLNSLRAAIGWRQFDTVDSNFRQAGWGHTHDGGRSWTFPGVIEPGVFRSDPVLDTDAAGIFYYNSLNSAFGPCFVFRSYDGGRTWDDGVYAFGGDKQWMAIDRTDGVGRGNIYANWTRSFSKCADSFTRSYDGGNTFIDCLEVPGDPQWGTMAVGPDGAVYVVGRGFVVAKSTTLQHPANPPAFDFAVPIDMGGNITFAGGPNPGGLLGQAWIAVDHSDGPTAGNVYALGSVSPEGADPLDVHFARSGDGGVTWSDPVRVNDVQDGWQWFGTMSVSPTGRIDVVWNDTRNDPDGFDSELHYSFSEDGGDTWSAAVAVSPPFDPHLGWPNQSKIGDYYDMVSDRLGAHVAYAATFNGEQDVYFLRIGDYDCNDNGIGDADDVAQGASDDVNANGIPDECECLGDIDGNGGVDFDDLLALLFRWGPCAGCPADLDGDDTVGFDDLTTLLFAWGPCRPSGACCLVDGTCAVRLQAQCLAVDGAYGGDGSRCPAVSCTQPGACCLPDGSCVQSAVGGRNCLAAGGLYQGDDTPCASVVCPQPGACCLPNGVCLDTIPPSVCAVQGGTYQGDDTLCADLVCPGAGACCVPDGTCLESVSLNFCVFLNGAFQGADSVCADVECVTGGACCFVDGACDERFEPDCLDDGGVYQGEGTVCAGASCPQPGACCMTDGSCAQAAELGGADCTSGGGTYQGDETDCANAACPQPGACCFPDFECTTLVEDLCTAAGGSFAGEDTICDVVDCSRGACCLADGSCFFTTPEICDILGGEHQGNGVSCESVSCP